MAGISPQILGGITPTQFRLLYKAPGGFISLTLPIFELSRLLKFSSFHETSEVTLVLIFISFFILMLFFPRSIFSAFYFLLLLHKYLLYFFLVYFNG